MNETSLINAYIIDDFKLNDLVNTLSIVNTDAIDLNKENIHPLVNVDMIDADVQDQVIIFEFIITALQQREISPQQKDSKLLSDSNYLDNINETLSIAQKFINKLRRQNNDLDIEISSLSDLVFLKDFRGAGLDGVQFTIDLSIPNLDTGC